MKLEEMEKELEKLNEGARRLKMRMEKLENFFKSLVEVARKKDNALVKDIVMRVKKDESFFQEFIEFLGRNETKRDTILRIVKRILIESVAK